jgi:hypothetical protein
MWKAKGIILIVMVSVFLITPNVLYSWGFWAHRQIHRQAVYLVPEPMAEFFRNHVNDLVEHSVDPDNRRRVDPTEGAKHYIDLDRYGNYPFSILPHRYADAVKKFSLDTLKENGLVPWRIAEFTDSLILAFKAKDKSKIIFYAASLGHYVADCNVPLHATENYDGQLTNQKGIHSRWESVLPEKFMRPFETRYAETYGLYYIPNREEEAFKWSKESFLLCEKVLSADLKAREGITSTDLMIKVKGENGRERDEFNERYYENYNREVGAMVEKRFNDCVVRVASVWYSAWVDAGKPILTDN